MGELGVTGLKRKLYSNTRRMSALFCVAIACVTVSALALRLTVLGDLSGGGPSGSLSRSSGGQSEQEGYALLPYNIARSVRFASPSARGNFRIENLETNEYYIIVSIIHPQTGQELWYSGLIGPGQERGEAALHVQLPSGTHECIARVTAYDPTTFQPRGSQERNITLHIG